MAKTETFFDVQMPLYELEAVYLACYSFLDRAYIRLEGDPKKKVRVRVKSKEGGDAAALAGEIENELIHQSLRAKTASTNQKIREHIITLALASAQGGAPEPADICAGGEAPAPAPGGKEDNLLDEELEAEVDRLLAEVEKEGGEDPLNIAAPWEEAGEKTTVKKKTSRKNKKGKKKHAAKA